EIRISVRVIRGPISPVRRVYPWLTRRGLSHDALLHLSPRRQSTMSHRSRALVPPARWRHLPECNCKPRRQADLFANCACKPRPAKFRESLSTRQIYALMLQTNDPAAHRHSQTSTSLRASRRPSPPKSAFALETASTTSAATPTAHG